MADAKIALFIDMDNIVYASENSGLGRMQISPILEVLKEKGRLMIKRAYADWRRHSGYRFELQQHAIELMELPQRGPTNKNSADIKMVVDAMEVAFTMGHIDTFAIITGDKDFSPLVTKLREHNFQVFGCGVRECTSDLLVQNCDEFIYYNNIMESRRLTSEMDRENIYQLLVDTVQALIASDLDHVSTTQLKKTLLRKNPAFHVGNFGFKSFTEFLKNASRKGVIHLRTDSRSGKYLIDLSKKRTVQSDETIIEEESIEIDYPSILSSVGVRPGTPDIRRKIMADVCEYLNKSEFSPDRILNSIIDELDETYTSKKIKIYKSTIRDIVRIMMYIGCFKDNRGRWISSYSVPISSFNCLRPVFWSNCFCLIQILKSDPALSDPGKISKILFGSERRKADLKRILKSMKSRNLLKESKDGDTIIVTPVTDRYIMPWK